MSSIKQLEHTLYNKIVDFLMSIPDINNTGNQRTLILRAGLDHGLQGQIQFGGSSTNFVPALVEKLIRYGKLQDGRVALEAILEAAERFVGLDKKDECESIIDELHELGGRPPALPSKPPLEKSWTDLVDAVKQLHEALLEKDYEFEYIVSFSGGGLLVADLLHILHRPKTPAIACIIRRYGAKPGKTRTMDVQSPSKRFFKNASSILLLDDVINTGNTLCEVQKFLKDKYNIQNIYTAVLGMSEQTPFKPHISIFTYYGQCKLPYGKVPRHLPSVPREEPLL